MSSEFAFEQVLPDYADVLGVAGLAAYRAEERKIGVPCRPSGPVTPAPSSIDTRSSGSRWRRLPSSQAIWTS